MAAATLIAPIGCSRTKTPPLDPDPPATGSDDEPLEGPVLSGIVRAARLRVEAGGNLTRDEAQVTVRVLVAGADRSDRARVELQDPGEAPDAPPLAAAAAGERIAVAPGRYRVAIRLRESETAVGQGAVGEISLEPGRRAVLTLEAEFATGSLVASFTNRGESVDAATSILVTPAGQGDPAEPATGAAGRSLRLPAGEYVVVATWTPEPDLQRTLERTIAVKPRQVTRLSADFGLSLSRLRVTVTDPISGRDLTADASVEIRGPGGKIVAAGAASLRHPMPEGTYSVRASWRQAPLVAVTATKADVVVRGPAPELDMDLAVRAGTFELTLSGDLDCKLDVDGAALGKATVRGLGPVLLPAGEWTVVARCPPHERTLKGIVIEPNTQQRRPLALP